MLTFAAKYYKNITSQFGENGILEEIINRVRYKLEFICEPTAVEFGAPTWDYCSNTAPLYAEGWHVAMYDLDPTDVRVKKMRITPENVNEVVGIPNLLSIDCDGPDYHIWKAYTGSPSVVIIEVNSSIVPPAEEIPGNRGASYMSMLKLGISKGYFLLCHTANMIFILNKYRHLFPEVVGDGVENWREYFNASHL